MFTNSPPGENNAHLLLPPVIQSASNLGIPMGGICVIANSVTLSGERQDSPVSHFIDFTESKKPILYKNRIFTFFRDKKKVCKIEIDFTTSKINFEIGNTNNMFNHQLLIEESKAFLTFNSALYYMCFGNNKRVFIDEKKHIEQNNAEYLNMIYINCLYIDTPKILISTMNNGYLAISVFFCDSSNYYDMFDNNKAPKCIELTKNIRSFVDQKIKRIDYSNFGRN